MKHILQIMIENQWKAIEFDSLKDAAFFIDKLLQAFPKLKYEMTSVYSHDKSLEENKKCQDEH